MKLPYFPDHDGSSFFDFVSTHHPELALRSHGLTAVPDQMRAVGPVAVPSATTVLAIKYQQGVVIAGDRRATEGFQIADRRIEKVFKVDDWSAMAIAGA
ncbi:MAG TPA: proteasome subunit beta, partial [Nitrospira sp.]